ncbi:MAG: 3',5'-cyclic-nucleotide phosphodiesterase pde1 [Sclerophora amabilis]|nr:MAG: 3',5'-cyclic-nucleotide phosphodiesterase pde1 [Sclerophora amabilis]
MKGDGETSGLETGGQSTEPSLQVIVLGSGGGPEEDNVTGLLVRSKATNWAKGSVLAVDAGTHLAAIARILNNHSPGVADGHLRQPVVEARKARGSRSDPVRNGTKRLSTHENNIEAPRPQEQSIKPDTSAVTGPQSPFPFDGLAFPHESATANAAFITRELVSTYLITHPHLDHISGFVINTASFQHTSRPKRLAALPSTIDAIKTHIFNDIIWPNLSDEDGGVGLVSFMRLAEGGNVALGEGEGRGYIEVCEGLAVKSRVISHGHCMKQHSHSGSGDGPIVDLATQAPTSHSPQVRTPSSEQERAHSVCVYGSTAYFIRDHGTGREVLVFGDVEPDSLSLSPRTARVWAEAAPKIVAGLLSGILIECSYDDSQPDETLFGHLAPRHLIEELKVLAGSVSSELSSRQDPSSAKRKRSSENSKAEPAGTPPSSSLRVRRGDTATTRRTRHPRPTATHPFSWDAPNGLSPKAAQDEPKTDKADEPDGAPLSPRQRGTSMPARRPQHPHRNPHPLKGVKIIIIHTKNTLRDGPPVGERILAQLEAYEREAQLGCSFVISSVGASFWL